MTGIVLAGGRSARMGQDKASVEILGVKLIDYVIAALERVADSVVIVGAGAGDHPTISDLYPGEGPLGGLITGMRYAGPGIHLAAACDMPLLSPAVLHYLVESAEGYDAAIPEAAGKLHPLCAAYCGDVLPELERAFRSGERSLTRAARRIHARIIPESVLRAFDPNLRSLLNINTPADRDLAETLLAPQPPVTQPPEHLNT